MNKNTAKSKKKNSLIKYNYDYYYYQLFLQNFTFKKKIIKRCFRKIFYFLLLYVFPMKNRKLF